MSSYLPLSQSTTDKDATTSPNSSFHDYLKSKVFRQCALIITLLIIIAVLFNTYDQTAPFIAQNTPAAVSAHFASNNETTDWSRFAYAQYVTDANYLCNSVMIFESLHRLGTQAELLMMYPHEWEPSSADDAGTEAKLLAKARDKYNANLVPIEVQRSAGQEPTWMDSFTKLLAFNQTQYDRVISLDSDATVLQPMDELFLLPSAAVAMPRAYWLDNGAHFLSSQLIVIEPSEYQFNHIKKQIKKHKNNEFDMEIVNNLFGRSCIVLPHRPYDLLTGEFHGHHHEKYLGFDDEEWDPYAVLDEAKFVHFSDWPYPKPWIDQGKEAMEKHMPKCHQNETSGQKDDCRDQDIWVNLYTDFRERREKICDV